MLGVEGGQGLEGMEGTTNLGMATRTEERMQTVSVGCSGYCLAGHSCALSQNSCSDPASRNHNDLLCCQTPVMIALALAYLGWMVECGLAGKRAISVSSCEDLQLNAFSSWLS